MQHRRAQAASGKNKRSGAAKQLPDLQTFLWLTVENLLSHRRKRPVFFL